MSSTRRASTLLRGSAPWSGHTLAWSHRGHVASDTAAVQALPPTMVQRFLKRYLQAIADGSTIADDWRGESEPFLEIEDDPNHGWFGEQVAFMQHPPRSRYAFVLAHDDEQRRIAGTDPELARRMNVRWTGDGVSLPRDLLVRAWRERAFMPERSGLPPTMDPSHPHYDPRTGSTPAAVSPVLCDD